MYPKTEKPASPLLTILSRHSYHLHHDPTPHLRSFSSKHYHSLQDKFEIQSNAILPGQTVLVVDDLIATGGSAHAAGELVAKLGGKVVEYLFIVGLPFLKVSVTVAERKMGIDIDLRVEEIKGEEWLDDFDRLRDGGRRES